MIFVLSCPSLDPGSGKILKTLKPRHSKSATTVPVTPKVLSPCRQGPEFNGYLVGRGNAKEIDLNRNFPDLNALMYYYEKTNGRNHHLPLPDNWEQQVSATG